MKKTALVLFLLVIGVSIFAQNGVIRDLSGTVELKIAGAAAYTPAKAGDSIARDTVISTGFKSSALVEVGNAIIVVRPLTRLTLTEISSSAGNETLNMNLQAGRVRVDVNPPAGTKASLSITSPSATASVRGTSFEFDTQSVRVGSGIVGFKGNQGYEVQAPAGSTVGLASALVTPASESLSQPPKCVAFDSLCGGPTGGIARSSERSGPDPTPKPPSQEPDPPQQGGMGPGYQQPEYPGVTGGDEFGIPFIFM